MEYRNHNGLKLSEIGVGCYSLSGAYGKKNINQFKNMINRAFELGVNFYDNADAYGDAEKILGKIIKPYRDKVIISTKVGVKNNIKPNLSYDYIKTACENSLQKLSTDYIDIYNVHFNDPDTTIEETLGALDDLVKEGKIRKYGLGHLPIERVVKYIEKGNIFSILMELSAISRSSSKELLKLCSEYDLGGIAFSVTGRGLLTGKFGKNIEFDKGDIRNLDPQFQRERLEFGLKIMKKLTEIGERHQKTPVQVAIAWVLAQPGIISALIGPSSIEHLEEDLGGSGWEISKEELNEIDKYINEKEEWLKKEQKKTVKNIIYSNLSNDVKKAFVDLIYCIETAIINGYVTEEKIMPTFYKLYGMESKMKQIRVIELENIQNEIKDAILKKMVK